jgi:EmrB/QacA subfamily drug resistance transporter
MKQDERRATAVAATAAAAPAQAMATQEPAEAPAAGGSAAAGRLTLPLLLSGTFMTFLDFFIVNVAIPSTQKDLKAGSGATLLFVAGYGLTYASMLITGARLGDIFGRRRVFIAGMALFTLASAACGTAPNALTLVTARMVQGVAAALLFPQALAIIGVVYTGTARARAYVAYGMTLGIAAVGGQLIGGALIQADPGGLGWRTCFLINLPIGLAACALTPRHVPESRAANVNRLDPLGVALVTLGLLALVLPLAEGRQQGWPLWTWLTLAAAPLLLGAFVAHQNRLGAAHRAGRTDRTPLIDLRLLRERAFGLGLLAVFAFYAALASYFLILALYLQQGRALDPWQSGVAVTPMGVGFFATTILARRLSARLGRALPALGALVLAGGLVWTAVEVGRVGTAGDTTALISPLLVDGLGMGMVTAPLITAVLAGVAPSRAGTASGVLSTMQQVGNSVGVAVIGVIFYSALGAVPARADFPHAFRAGAVYLVCADLTLAVLLSSLPKRRG